MAKRLLLFALMSILALGIIVSVQADTDPPVINWVTDDWQPDPTTLIPTLTIDDLTWDSGNDGEAIQRLTGPAPCVGDPDVHQVIKNNTPVAWTDWHVSIQNGVIEAAIVKKVGGANWIVTIANDGSSFTAETALQSGKVARGGYLDVWFRYTCSGTGNVVIDEYPTTGYIPEPSSMMALLSAVMALGLGRIRRKP